LADQDLGQIRRRGSPQRTGNHVQGGQGAGQRSPLQSLDLHLPRSNDRSHTSLPLHPVLLLETVPEQHQRPACSIPDGTSGSANGLQHDSRPHSPLKTIVFIFVQLDLSNLITSVKPPKERERYTITK
jgi:hypothetical protein